MNGYMDKDLFMTPRVNQYGNHMVMSNVSKETKVKYLNIDTKFCDDIYYTMGDNETYLSDYNFTLPDRITDVKSIIVENIEFPSGNLYNISQTIGNNCFQLMVSNVPEPTLITVPDGFYTDASLNQAINLAINGHNLYFYLDTSTLKTYIMTDASNATTISYKFKFAVNKTNTFDKYNFKTKLGWILGFRNPTYTIYSVPNNPINGLIHLENGIVTFNTIYNFNIIKQNILQPSSGIWIVSEMCYCFVVPKYYYLVIDEFSTNFQNAFSSALPFSIINKFIMSKIHINNTSNSSSQNPNSTNYISANLKNGLLVSGKRNYNGKIDIQKLNVKIIDDNGNLVNLLGFDFSFCLKIEYE